jgi:DNA-binding LytR/AlgR family response regulator
MDRCRIAIVDDSDAFAESLAVSLVITGGVETKTMRPAATAEQTLGEILAWRADVVVVDVCLAAPWSGARLAAVLDGFGSTVIVATAASGVALPDGCSALILDKAVGRRELVAAVLAACPEVPA